MNIKKILLSAITVVMFGVFIFSSVAEVNAMLVGTLNGIPVKSLSTNNSSFEMIPIRNI